MYLLYRKSISITQEIEFSGKVESVTVWHKSVVPLIFWFDVINGQFVDPVKVKTLSFLIGVMAYTQYMSSPANMGDIYSAVRLDFHTILVPGSSYVLVWHLALKNCLILCLHREVCDTLVDLQLFLYTARKTDVQNAENTTCRGLQTSGEVWWLERAELDAVRWWCVRIIWFKKRVQVLYVRIIW